MAGPVHTVIPYKAGSPKSRLSPALRPAERKALADAMLLDVLDAAIGARLGPVTVLATGKGGLPRLPGRVRVETDPRPLTPAVNRMLERLRRRGWPRGGVAVLVPDVPLAEPDHLRVAASMPQPVVLAPGRRGGTSLLLARDRSFRADYHRGSFRKHLEAARALGLEVGVLDSFRLAQDVDEPDDLLELLLHGRGRAAGMLRGLGFGVAVRGLHPVLLGKAGKS
ncbi:MAG: 2-phospho-L-lactate guanylyltransferase [Halobacteria archaeon]